MQNPAFDSAVDESAGRLQLIGIDTGIVAYHLVSDVRRFGPAGEAQYRPLSYHRPALGRLRGANSFDTSMPQWRHRYHASRPN